MRQMAKFVAVLACSLFTRVSVYINLVAVREVVESSWECRPEIVD